MKLSDFLFIFDLPSTERFIVHFEDLDITDDTVYGSLYKYRNEEVLSFSITSDRTFVLELRCS